MDDRMLLMAKSFLPVFSPEQRPMILMLLHFMEIRLLIQHFEDDNKLLHCAQKEMSMEEVLLQFVGPESKDMMEQAMQFMNMMDMMNQSEDSEENECV